MFNADYFKSDLIQQIEQLGVGACCVAVHLTDRTTYAVRKYDPDGAKRGYVMLEVYPEEGVTEESKKKRRKPGGTDEVFYDRVAIAYEYITRVFLSVVGPDERSIVGFATPAK